MDHGGETRRPTAHPWLLASAAAAVAALVTTLTYPPESGSVAYALGQQCGYLLVPWLLAALAMRSVSWPWWASAGAALVVFVAVLGAVATAGRVTHPSVEVAAPTQVGEWRKQDDPTSRRLVLRTEARLDTMPEGVLAGEAAVGIYRLGRGSLALVAFPVGRALADDFASDPEQGAIDYLNGATGDDAAEAVDPGPLGGGLACTDASGPPGAIACAWADARTSGQLGFQVRGLTIEEAVPVVHLFREAVMAAAAG